MTPEQEAIVTCTALNSRARLWLLYRFLDGVRLSNRDVCDLTGIARESDVPAYRKHLRDAGALRDRWVVDGNRRVRVYIAVTPTPSK